MLLALLAFAGARAGAAAETPAPAPAPQRDPHSYGRPDEVAVEHLSLDLTVDFDQRVLRGKATLRIANKTGSEKLHLDSRDLAIRRVTLDDGSGGSYTLAPPDPLLGSDLEIGLTPQTRSVTIEYETSPGASALQWLAPEQTASKKLPFLYTQSQAILARTWVPCQDSPGARMTYDATVRVPPGFLALMSAENPTALAADGVYRFRMEQPVPSYLLALAVGDLRFRALGADQSGEPQRAATSWSERPSAGDRGSNTGVYAEPATIDAAAAELRDLPGMMTAAEKLYGKYRWGRYDVLFLPPSFPFGGMENPRLTFATPTLLAGDRSLVSVIAHELAHSWSGNLVTNATWNDFWLNEGFTNYFESRIMEEVFGRDYADMLRVLSFTSLREEVASLGATNPATQLFVDWTGKDPDEGVSAIAYDKGALFLRKIEEVVGRERWDAFLRSYFDDFAFQSMTTARFERELDARLLAGHPQWKTAIAPERWIHGPGIPDNAPDVRAAAFAEVEREAAAFVAGTPAAKLRTKEWTTHHWLHFLESLPKTLTTAQVADLDSLRFDQRNFEVREQWLELVIAHRYEPAFGQIEPFLTAQGRRKYLKPIYTGLMGFPAGQQLAKQIYAKARPTYHAVSRDTLDGIVGWGKETAALPFGG
jgi:aminopeptidase N